MIPLILWALTTGLIWALVGVIYGKAPSDKKAFYTFYLLYSIVYMISSIAMVHPPRVDATELLKIAAIIIPMSFISMIGFVFLKKAMENGSQGIAWCVTQSAVVVPFLGSTFFLGSKTGVCQWIGIAVLAASLALLGLSKQNGTGKDGGKGFWKYTILAFALVGISQFMQMIPGHIGCSAEALEWRVPVMTPAGVIWWAVICTSTKSFEFKQTWKQSLLYGLVVVLGQIIFLKAVDAGDACKMTAVVYPIAVGTCICLFSIYCAIFRHEKVSAVSALGTVLNVAGIILLSVK